jgi:two-component system, LytTR family, sensor kinase
VKFGVARASRPVTVCVEAVSDAANLLLRIWDDAPPVDEPAAFPAGLGIGIRNVVERLASRYGPAAQLTSDRTAHGHVTTIRLPLNR